VLVEELRMSALRGQVAELQAKVTVPERPRHDGTRSAGQEGQDPALATKLPRPTGAGDATGGPGIVRGGAESRRKVTGNPAAGAISNPTQRAMAAAHYADLIKQLDLTQSESEHLIALLAAGMADQQEFRAKLLAAGDAAARNDFTQQLKRKTDQLEREIRDFLNDGDDYQSYQDYVARLPERQQLDGIRSSMKDAADPLTSEQETGLVEALHAARSKSMPADLWGRAEGASGDLPADAEQRFEQAWTTMQQSLRKEVSGLLDPRQNEAFFRHQEMVKEMKLGSIRMARQLLEEGNPNAKPAPVSGP
jgi:hypothetical protein